MAIARDAVKHWLLLSSSRAAALTQQIQVLVRFDQQAAVDLTPLTAAVLLFGQSYAQAVRHAYDWMLQDPDFPALPLVMQEVAAEHSLLWTQMMTTIGTLAFERRLTSLDAFVQSIPADRFTGIHRAAAVAAALEQVVSINTRAGVSFPTFWAVTDEARQSIARLVLFDVALAPRIEFSPLTEVFRVLEEGTPLVPDLTTLVAAVAAVRPTVVTERRLPRVLSYVVQAGMGIEDIALATLGDAARWQELVEFNRLRFPYVAPVAPTVLGEVLAHKVLAFPTVIGEQTATFLDVEDLMIDQRLRLSWNGAEQIVTIQAIDTATATLTFAESFTLAFPTVAVVEVYAPAYDVAGRVLAPGDTLLVPTDSLTEGAVVTGFASTPQVTAARLFGVDLWVKDGMLRRDQGDLLTVSGLENLRQALLHRFLVEQGTLPYHPTYGTGLYQYVGMKAAPYFTFLAQVDARQTVLRDPRITTITRMQAEVDGDALTIELEGVTTSSEQFPPLTVTVPLR